MTILGTAWHSTSASGAMLVREAREPAYVGIILVGPGTSSAIADQVPHDFGVGRSPATSAGVGLPEAEASTASGEIAELRRRSGLTWDQLSRLFGVSRRALHFWASGKPMTRANEEHLQRLLAVLRRFDRGVPSATRCALMQVGVGGAAPFDLLVARRYEQAMMAATAREVVALPRWPSSETVAARAPLPPEQLVEALQDRPRETGRAVRPAASVKVRRRRGGA
jgi:transcriptional regulator with XRE-family HTH domain